MTPPPLDRLRDGHDDDDDLDGCVPHRWLGTFESDGKLYDVLETADEDIWLYVLFASVMHDPEAADRRGREWRDLNHA